MKETKETETVLCSRMNCLLIYKVLITEKTCN